MDLGLKGKKVVITGGSRGIGRAIANFMIAEGADVAICARNEEEVNAAVAELGASGKAIGAAVDVADKAALQGWIASAAAEHGFVRTLRQLPGEPTLRVPGAIAAVMPTMRSSSRASRISVSEKMRV